MPLVRMLCSWGPVTSPVADRMSNTLYFNVSGSVDDPNYGSLATDLLAIYAGLQPMVTGCKIEIRAYDMRDAKPRPERAYATQTLTGTWADAARQVAVALSYYGDRNLPRTRGRIFLGPYVQPAFQVPVAQRTQLTALATSLAGLGGLNVDWSVYSPTTDTEGHGETGHQAIKHAWVDNSWDVIRSRKTPSTARSTIDLNG